MGSERKPELGSGPAEAMFGGAVLLFLAVAFPVISLVLPKDGGAIIQMIGGVSGALFYFLSLPLFGLGSVLLIGGATVFLVRKIRSRRGAN